MAIYEEVLENNNKTAAFRERVLKESGIVDTLLSLNHQANFSFGSERQIRHGYMGLLTRVSNTLTTASFNQEVNDFLEGTSGEWAEYVSGDLKQRNEVNSKKLGGQEPKNQQEEDETTFESMDSIMHRFENFSQRSQQSQDEDDDNEAEEFDSHADTEASQTSSIIDVDLPEPQDEAEGLMNYGGNVFWSRKPELDEELDLSDFE